MPPGMPRLPTVSNTPMNRMRTSRERASSSSSSAVRGGISPVCISRRPGAVVSRYRAKTASVGRSVGAIMPHFAIMPARLRAAKAPRL